MLFHFFECLQRSCEHCFFTFYRCRVAREQYFCRFIVVARRGNNIFAFYRHRAAREQYFRVLSSPCSAGTISLPFYRRRAAREQYLCHFIVAVQRGNNTFAVLSSPCSAGTIFLHFIVCSITASNKIFVFTFAEAPQAPFFAFCHLHKLYKHHFLRFAICISYASAIFYVLAFA